MRLIFRKYVDEGYGAQRLCKYLHESGMRAAYSNSARSVKFSGRWNIASFRKAG